ncbi:hypothetical protein BU16DRAFT_115966 [Lophium mytilinum]|uniref:FAS1 domain-containing protein n=1 Tax=Lophium mytilinum TaxID=390894 RepID=A0A6A6QFX2_9PEZI|nr:hypothetical protein BU16DRAFT_115966 [Lophium mytilinum]
MKSFTTTAILSLTVAAYAAPTRNSVRQTPSTCIVATVYNPDVAQIEASITQWFSDVVNVNAFLDGVAANSLTTDLATAAQNALTNAQDEPCQLATLSSNAFARAIETAAFDCATEDLMDIFGVHVIDNLNLIIANPTNTQIVTQAVNDINQFRCCNVLTDATILWLDNAADNGLVGTVQTDAPREQACSAIQCTQKCTGFDNGVFGTVTV